NSLRTITDIGFKNSSAKKLPAGTILFSSRATVGDVSIALNECTTNQGFQSFIVNESNNNEFIYYWILKNKNIFIEKASGSTFLEISKKEIEKISIKRPSLLEQTKIANFLTTIDEKISQSQTYLETVKQYKQGLLQQMFI
ncbi:MAG: restriction endonuclease subunit S, partial [Dolichospermum sp.]